MKLNLDKQNFRLFGPDETASNRLEAVYEASGKEWMAEVESVDIDLSVDGRSWKCSVSTCVRLARRISIDGTPWPVLVLRGLRSRYRFDVQSARKVVEGNPEDSLA